MFNMGSMLRARNVFGGQDASPSNDPNDTAYDPYNNREKFKRLDFGTEDTSVTSNVSDRPEGQDKNPFGDAYTRMTEAESGPQHKAYNEALAAAPSRDDFKPGKTRKLAAILAGLSGDPDAGRSVMDANYDRANYDYKERLARLKQGADTEHVETNDKRQFMRDVLNDDRGRNAQNEKHILDQSTINVNNARIKKLSSPSNPTGSFKDELTGHRYAFQDGQKIDLGVVDETPQQKSDRSLKRGQGLASYTSNLAHLRYENERGSRKEDTKEIQSHASNLTAQRQLTNAEKEHLRSVAKDKVNPLRVYAARELAYRDIISDNPQAADSIDIDKGTHTPDIDAVVKEYMKRYDPQ